MGLIGETFVRVRPDVSTFRLETQAGIAGALGGVGAGGLRASLGFAGITTAATAFALAAREAIGGAASLEEELNVFQVVGEATEEQMAAVAEEAVRLGANLSLPAVSAGDAARAMTELARGGLDVNDVLGGTEGVLQLAAAAELEVADAAQIAARALTTFQLPGTEAANVANLLVGAANAATGEVSDMALALQQAGAVASQVGLSLDDTVTAISLLAKNGIIGSDAGTSLRTTLLRLIPTTKEAAEVVDALGVNVSDAEGNLRPLAAIFEDYRVALARLTPVLQQEALTQIFGTDAIRAAAVFSQEGAAGFAALEEAVTREGQAAETAAAKSEGLSGSARGLRSNLETLATELGEKVNPGLQEFTDFLADATGHAIDLLNEIERANETKLPDWLTGGNADIDNDADDWGRLGDAVGYVNKQLEDLLGIERPSTTIPAPTIDLQRSLIPEGLQAKGRIEGRLAGEQIGRSVSEGLADGVEDAAGSIAESVLSAEREAIDAARQLVGRVIREGREAVAEAIRQGREAVRLSAIDARTNLISLGRDLAADAVALIDEGPLARRIDRLRDQLSRSSAGAERRGLQEAIRDAQRELSTARENVEIAGPVTPAVRAAQERFLEPFERNLRDAKAALGEFTTEGVIEKLQAQAETQKQVVQQGIADLIVQFNQGGLDLVDLNQSIARLLERNGVQPFGQAGRTLGVAFRQEWLAAFRAMTAQAREIIEGIDVPQVGLEPRVVSPSGERRTQDEIIAGTRQQAAEREAAARDSLRRAQTALRRATEENTDALNDLPERIERAFRRGTTRRSSERRDDATTGIQR